MTSATDSSLKIAILTPFFFPDFGGTQRAVEILAREFMALGHDVRITTLMREPRAEEQPFSRGEISPLVKIVRNASPFDVLATMRWADVGLVLYPTLRLGLPVALSGKPSVMAHHFDLRIESGLKGRVRSFLRRYLMRHTLSVACSQYLANTIEEPTRVVFNGYRDDIWAGAPADIDRPTDILFVGRLVPDKGVDLMLATMAELKARGRCVSGAMIGAEGDGLSAAEMMDKAGVSDIVQHLGPLPSSRVAAAQAHAKICVIPSRAEAFGIVALEAMAMGAVVVASDCGGLPEAVGSAGKLIASREPGAWADQVERLLDNPAEMAALRAAAPAHLAKFGARAMGEGYLDALRAAMAHGQRLSSALTGAMNA